MIEELQQLLFISTPRNSPLRRNPLYMHLFYNYARTSQPVTIHIMAVSGRLRAHFAQRNASGQLINIHTSKTIENLTLPYCSYVYVPVIPTNSPNISLVPNYTKVDLHLMQLITRTTIYKHFQTNSLLTKQLLQERPLQYKICQRPTTKLTKMPQLRPASKLTVKQIITQAVTPQTHYNKPENYPRHKLLQEEQTYLLNRLRPYLPQITANHLTDAKIFDELHTQLALDNKIAKLLNMIVAKGITPPTNNEDLI